MTHSYDQPAIKILFDTYWSSNGWKSENERNTSPEDFAYAKNKGVMFDIYSIGHDEIITKLAKLVATLSLQRVSQAFLYSLTTRDLAYRSALGSYAMSFWMPPHSFVGDRSCTICGDYHLSSAEDYNVLNFERLKWGGIRHMSPLYQLFDLTEFLKLPEIKATDKDVSILRGIIKIIESLPATARPRDVEKAISAHIKSSKSERDILIQILAYCGILQPKNRTGFFQEYTKPCEREHRPVNKLDWNYPISWWQGSDGVNYEALKYYFPFLA